MNIERILVAVDFSSDSEAALNLALALTEGVDGTLHLIHILPESVGLAPPHGPALSTEFGMNLERMAVDRLQRWLEKFCPVALSVTTCVRSGDPSKRITEAADELGVDLIVMGTRGTTGLKHLFVGSVANRTVGAARCPVLTTHADP